MKTAPQVQPPRLVRSDIVEARQVLGREPGQPVGVVLSQYGFAELRAYGCRFPCPVAVDPHAPRETIAWFYLPENFAPFTNQLRA
jgi:hypothetical protein